MTEAEWLECDDSYEMLEHIRSLLTERKVRLFAVACCRRIDRLLPHESHRIALDVADQFADGIVSLAPLEGACQAVQYHAHSATWAVQAACAPSSPLCPKCGGPMSVEVGMRGLRFHQCSSDPQCHATRYSLWGIVGYASFAGLSAVSVQSQVMRDIVGNPFRPVAVEPSWLTPTVVQLAEHIYQERAFDQMPILADALQDVECDNDDILNHLRQPGEHVRGCWAVDLLTGRK